MTRLLLIVGLALGSVACGDDDGGADTDGDSGSDESPGGDTDAAVTEGADDGSGAMDGKVKLTLTIVDEVAPIGVNGFEVCTTDDDPTCETSNDEGLVTLAVAADSEVVLHIDKDNYPAISFLAVTETSDVEVSSGFPFPTQATINGQLAAAGVTQDPDKGWVTCVVNGTVEGATMSASPEGGDGPFYWVDDLPDPSAEGFPPAFGVASIFNLDEGDVEVRASVPDADCTANPFPGDEEGSLRVPIEAGRFTWGCDFGCSVAVPVTFTTTADTFEDVAACEADTSLSDTTTECTACACGACLDEINTCNETEGCLDIIQCALTTDCGEAGCYGAETCMAELDGTEGGVLGAASTAATAWGECSAAACQPESCREPANQ